MTNSNKSKPNKKVVELIKQLESEEAKQVIKAINGLKVHGNETAIEPLIKLHTNTKNNAVKAEIETLLNSIKSTKAVEEVINCLTDDEYKNSHQAILSSIWNSNLDYSLYLDEIVAAAIEGDMMHAMECLTIFENLEGEMTEEKILNPLLSLNQFLNDNSGSDDPKYTLLLEVAQILQNINNSL